MAERQPGYAGRSVGFGPPTYRDTSFKQMIFDATGLGHFSGTARVVDVMSARGLVTKDLRESAPQHEYVCLDCNPVLAVDVRNTRTPIVLADVRNAPFLDDSLDVIVGRYSLKDLTQEEQPMVVKDLFRALKPGGVLVIADMVSPSDESKFFLNSQHAKKQELEGVNDGSNGTCHIPTEDEWIKMLKDSGFEVTVADEYVSRVATAQWVGAKQVTDEHRKILDVMIMGADDRTKEEFNIRQEGDDVKIDYPVRVFRAVKPKNNVE